MSATATTERDLLERIDRERFTSIRRVDVAVARRLATRGLLDYRQTGYGRVWFLTDAGRDVVRSER